MFCNRCGRRCDIVLVAESRQPLPLLLLPCEIAARAAARIADVVAWF